MRRGDIAKVRSGSMVGYVGDAWNQTTLLVNVQVFFGSTCRQEVKNYLINLLSTNTSLQYFTLANNRRFYLSIRKSPLREVENIVTSWLSSL